MQRYLARGALGALAIVAIVALGGCVFSQDGATPKVANNVEFKGICAIKKYNISISSIKAKPSSVVAQSEFEALLKAALLDSNCFEIEPNNGAYKLSITYDVRLEELKEELNAISSKSSAILEANVSFWLKNDTDSINQSGTSTLKLNEKQYFGIGQKPSITHEQKEQVVKRALRTILTALSNMP